jgi:uncharacterized membrane protein
MTRLIATLMIAALPFAAVGAAQASETPAKEQTASVKKELQKLMDRYGAGEISSKEYKARKEALLKGETPTQVGSNSN